ETDDRVGDGLLDLGREGQAAFLDVALDELLEAGLVDRDLTGFESRDLSLVDIDARDVVSALGKTRTGNQADVAGPNDTNLHSSLTPRSGNCLPQGASGQISNAGNYPQSRSPATADFAKRFRARTLDGLVRLGAARQAAPRAGRSSAIT